MKRRMTIRESCIPEQEIQVLEEELRKGRLRPGEHMGRGILWSGHSVEETTGILTNPEEY